jgi:beta-glucosidase
VKWLAGFAVVEADPGESVNIGILLPERAFQHWSEKGWAIEAGTFALAAGSSSAALALSGSVTMEGAT